MEAACREGGVEAHTISCQGPAARELIEGADAVIIATPTYRESYPGMLKTFFDTLPRGAAGEDGAPLAGKPVGIVMTGASPHHYLALNSLHGLLVGSYAALVAPVSVYGQDGQFDEDRGIADPALAERATLLGRTLVQLGRLLAPAPQLRALRPQI